MSPKANQKVAVKVPKDHPEQYVIRTGGLDPVTYKVEGGAVQVDEADVDRFLAAVEGSTTSGGTPAAQD